MGKTMQDVKKNQYRTRQPTPPPKRRRRKRNLTLYYLMIFIFVTIAGVTLSLTVLFKITAVNVIGTTQYDTNSIVASSNIKIGDNLFRTDYDKAKEKILKDLIYIDDVEIKKTITCQVNITVEPSVAYANVAYDEGYILISKSGKILEILSAPKEGTFIFNGYEPVDVAVGEKITSEDSDKSSLLKDLCKSLDKLNISNVTQIDISDRYNIILVYENRINFEMGSQSDLEYKLNYANELLANQIGKNKEGTIFMRGDNGVGFIEKSDLEKYEQSYNSATLTQQTSVGSDISETTKTTKKAAD